MHWLVAFYIKILILEFKFHFKSGYANNLQHANNV